MNTMIEHPPTLCGPGFDSRSMPLAAGEGLVSTQIEQSPGPCSHALAVVRASVHLVCGSVLPIVSDCTSKDQYAVVVDDVPAILCVEVTPAGIVRLELRVPRGRSYAGRELLDRIRQHARSLAAMLRAEDSPFEQDFDPLPF